MPEIDERSYVEGTKAFARRILQQCHAELGGFDGRSYSDLLLERDEVRAALRDICGRLGDNEWEDDLHLVDVLQKHLEPYLPEAERVDEP